MVISLWLDELRQDLAFALRQLQRTPLFALIAIATRALGFDAAFVCPSPSGDSVVRAIDRACRSLIHTLGGESRQKEVT